MGVYVGRWSLIIVLLSMMTGCGGSKSSSTTGRLEDRTILMILEWGFSDGEFNRTRPVFESAGAQVVTASGRPRILSTRGMVLLVDKLLSEVKVEEYDAIVFVGGRGAMGYWDDPVAHRIAQEAMALDKVLGAICLAPMILANAGVLDGRRATMAPAYGDSLKAQGAVYTGASLEVDGKIVTAYGPESPEQLAMAIVNLLSARGRRVLVL